MDQEAQIIELRGRVSGLEADVENLVGWQKAQNGSIHYVRDQVDEMKKLLNKVLTRVTFAAIGFAASAVLLYLQVVK